MKQVRHLKLKWRSAFPETITARLPRPPFYERNTFVGSAGGAIQAVDAKTGCLHWVFQRMDRCAAAILPFEMAPAYSSRVWRFVIGWVYSLERKNGQRAMKRARGQTTKTSA